MVILVEVLINGIEVDEREHDRSMKFIKKMPVLLTPISLFAVLFIPYSLLNQHFIVE